MTEFRINTPGPSYTRNEDYIETVVAETKKYLPLKRGWKHVVENTLLTNDGTIRRAAYIRVLNSKGVVQKGHGAVVYSTEPTAPVEHRSVMSGEVMKCRDCGSTLWYDLGRSLFSYNFKCANLMCGAMVHPVTESGACN